jgi:hypothetical protein
MHPKGQLSSGKPALHERGGPTISTPPNRFNRTLTPDTLAWQPTGLTATITRRWKFIDPINLHRIWAFATLLRRRTTSVAL